MIIDFQVTRLETQLGRYKTAAEEAEAREDDLKVERRKLQREVRPSPYFLAKIKQCDKKNLKNVFFFVVA